MSLRRAVMRMLVLVLVLALAALPLGAEAANPSPDYKDAVARLSQAHSPTDYASALDSLSANLTPTDSLALLDLGLSSFDSLPKSSELRRSLLVKAGDLALLLGLVGDAAARYEEAAALAQGGADFGLLLRASRCYLASGEVEKANAISESLVASGLDADIAASARLVAAWSLLLQGRGSDASSQVSALLGEKGKLSSAARREALFILWLGAPGGAAGAERKARADALAAEFPGSPEALVASGAASPPPLAHWYLGGLVGALAPAPPIAAVPTAPAATVKPLATPSAPATGKRLQVGYFSLAENAQQLKDELSSKGFAASIEARTRSGGAGKSDEKRWIVVVGAGKAIADTMQRLKDSGYESYVIEN